MPSITTPRVLIPACLAGITALVIVTVPAVAVEQRTPVPGWSSQAIDAWARDAGISRTEASRLAVAQDHAVAVAGQLEDSLGERAAGTWLTPQGQLVVNVLDEQGAESVRAAGGSARLVDHSTADLSQALAALDATPAPTGVSWGVDVAANSLVVTVPDGVDGSAFLATAQSLGVPVEAESAPSMPATQAFYGGEAILLSGGGRCSAGFVTQAASGNQYLVTAGHCTASRPSFSDESGTAIGPTAASRFPGDDFGAVRISNPGALGPDGAVATADIVYGDGAGESGIVDITAAGRVPVGGQVCKAGSTTGYTCGSVQAYDVTVNYAEGRVSGLTQTNVCTQPGDSGGALIAGSLGQGVVSGGSSNLPCSSASFQSFFQPLDEVLDVWGLTVR